jgi:hypothetical protein
MTVPTSFRLPRIVAKLGEWIDIGTRWPSGLAISATRILATDGRRCARLTISQAEGEQATGGDELLVPMAELVVKVATSACRDNPAKRGGHEHAARPLTVTRKSATALQFTGCDGRDLGGGPTLEKFPRVAEFIDKTLADAADQPTVDVNPAYLLDAAQLAVDLKLPRVTVRLCPDATMLAVTFTNEDAASPVRSGELVVMGMER